jgi:hypothetical protein
MEWQDIATAPKDRTRVLLYRPSELVWAQTVAGYWDSDEYAAKPRPYWTSDVERLVGVVACRKNNPTHWMPLPAPPTPAPQNSRRVEERS